jgi:hypothetical protein
VCPVDPNRAIQNWRSLSVPAPTIHAVDRVGERAPAPDERTEDRPDYSHSRRLVPQRVQSLTFRNASHAARCVACQGVGSHPVPVALVAECSMPVV